MKLKNVSEQAQLAKADARIQKVDMEVELKNIDDDDDEDADFMLITDGDKLKKIIKSLKTVRASRAIIWQ